MDNNESRGIIARNAVTRVVEGSAPLSFLSVALWVAVGAAGVKADRLPDDDPLALASALMVHWVQSVYL